LIYEYSVAKTFPKIEDFFVRNTFDIVFLAKLETKRCSIERIILGVVGLIQYYEKCHS
jgi:hypothetical protein